MLVSRVLQAYASQAHVLDMDIEYPSCRRLACCIIVDAVILFSIPAMFHYVEHHGISQNLLRHEMLDVCDDRHYLCSVDPSYHVLWLAVFLFAVQSHLAFRSCSLGMRAFGLRLVHCSADVCSNAGFIRVLCYHLNFGSSLPLLDCFIVAAKVLRERLAPQRADSGGLFHDIHFVCRDHQFLIHRLLRTAVVQDFHADQAHNEELAAGSARKCDTLGCDHAAVNKCGQQPCMHIMCLRHSLPQPVLLAQQNSNTPALHSTWLCSTCHQKNRFSVFGIVLGWALIVTALAGAVAKANEMVILQHEQEAQQLLQAIKMGVDILTPFF